MAVIPNDPTLPDVEDATFEPGQVIDNPYAPFLVGQLMSYVATEAGSDEIDERSDVFVTAETRMIEGVAATVVRDTVYDSEGRWVEDTLDWYAQDAEGAVWYLGELSYSFEYDEDTGEFLGAEPDGSWEWGVDGALPGHIRPAASAVGDSYYQEFYPGVAEDAGQVLALDEEVSIDFGDFTDVIKTFDFSTSELDAREFKYAAAGYGVIMEEGLDEDDNVEDVTTLVGARQVTPSGEEADEVLLADLDEGEAILPDEADREDFEDGAQDLTVSFLGGVDDAENAVGVYQYDVDTGEIGEARILFASSDAARTGAGRTVEVAAGHGLGVFIVADADAAGVDLAQFRDGGLFLRNLSADAPARLDDGLAPVATDAAGDLLPLSILHGFDDATDAVNLLNGGGGAAATELELSHEEGDEGGEEDDLHDLAEDGVLLGFEERISTHPDFDGDFNDVVLAISDNPLSDAARAEISGMFDSEIMARGGDAGDRLVGGGFEDRLFGRRGDDILLGRGDDDRLRGGRGDDLVKASEGDDWFWLGRGDDAVFGGRGEDRARFRGEQDGYEIESAGDGVVVRDIDRSDGNDGVDTLVSVELLRFDDALLTV